MSDPYNLKEYIRTVDDFPIDGIKFRDITSLIETPDAFIKTCYAMDELTKAFNPSVVVSIESRGFIFAGSISKDLALPFVLARKPGKLPNESYTKEFDLEYGSTSIEIQKNTSITDKDRVVIIDDLIATGGTAIACAELLTENFGVLNENILVIAVIDLPDLGGSKLIADQGYSVETLVGYSDS
jgi:adenine phosphoribosyltransferase